MERAGQSVRDALGPGSPCDSRSELRQVPYGRGYLAKNGFQGEPGAQEDALTQRVLPEPWALGGDGPTFLCVCALPGILLLSRPSTGHTELCGPDAVTTHAFPVGGGGTDAGTKRR